MAACKKGGDEAQAAGANDLAVVTVGPENIAVVSMTQTES
jgi:hypothetical protein